MSEKRYIRPDEAELMRAIVRKNCAAKGIASRSVKPAAVSDAVPQLLALASQAVGLAGGDEVAALRNMERRVLKGSK